MSGVKDDDDKAPARFFYFRGLASMIDQKHGVLAIRYEVLLESLVMKDACVKGDLNFLTKEIIQSLMESFKIHPAEVLKEVSYVSELGANKYGIFNYKTGMKWSRLMDATARHLLHHVMDDYIDEESTKDHRYHILANLFMLAYYIDNNAGENDLIEETVNEQQSVPEAEDKVQD